MTNFDYEIRDRLAWVTFDSGAMNTLSKAAIEELGRLRAKMEQAHGEDRIEGVILKGNRYGLGAGANIGELLGASTEQLAALIDQGHEQLTAIEEGRLPWLAVVDGFALGGIYELALACHGIVATKTSTVGFPEIRLNIFPGLGGTQRMPRRAGLINAEDPVGGDAGFTAILQGKNFPAPKAAAIRMIDAVIPEGEDIDGFAADFIRNAIPVPARLRPADLSGAKELKPMIMPMIEKATMGRSNPRAPYVALELMIKGAELPLRDGLRLERDAFIDVAASAEGKAGMRFFFTQQKVSKLPKELAAKAAKISKVGIDGIDGYMGNAIGWLALEAGYEVVGHVPLEKFAASVAEKLKAKYARAVRRGKLSEQESAEKVSSVAVATDVSALFDCDLVIEARMEDRTVKADFFHALGKGLKPGAFAASNSSSMGPAMLGADLAGGGGDASRFVNLHFFSPAEHPMMQLVEIVRGEAAGDEAVATAHAFVKSIGKTPLLLRDGSPGFLVNAGLAAYFEAAEDLYLEGTPIEAVDAAIKASVLPMGPFELGDQAGLDIGAGLFDTIAAETTPGREPLVWKMREIGRLGVKSGAGYYDYSGGTKAGEWEGLSALAGKRGGRRAADDEIVRRCMRALYDTASGLCARGIVGSEEEADLAFVLGIGFAMYLGGPIYYGKQQGWDRA